jgi:2-octaprenyl-6-methoxyphenol hydroxylase
MTSKQLAQTISTPQPLGFDYDLAIAGGGIVGLTLACALKDSGLRVALIEAQAESVSVAKGRAYVISLLSGRIFTDMGIFDEMLPEITTFNQISLSDADYPKVVQFHPQDLGTDGLGYAAEHRVLLTALQNQLKNCPNVEFLCPAEVVRTDYQADGVEIELRVTDPQSSSAAARSAIQNPKSQADGVEIELQLSEEPQSNPQSKIQNPKSKIIKTRLLVAADGARSRIRQAAGIQTKGWPYWQSCIVATIKPEKAHNNAAYERFWPSGPMGVLPLTGNRCQVVWTSPHAEAKSLLELDEKAFLELLEHRTGGLLGKLELIGGRYLFPVQLMQSDRYTLHRLALIGDAAHCCHPVAGQGMNLGIRDAAALAQVLQEAHNKGEDIGDIRVLKRYERWRKLENLTILGFTDFLDRMFSNNWLPAVGIRRVGLWMLRQIRPFKIFALQLMTGLKGRPPKLESISSTTR